MGVRISFPLDSGRLLSDISFMSRTENLGFNGDYKTTTQTISLKKGSAFTFTSYRERLKLAAVGERKRKWEAERDN